MFFNPPSPAQWVSARQGSSSLFLEELRALTSIYGTGNQILTCKSSLALH